MPQSTALLSYHTDTGQGVAGPPLLHLNRLNRGNPVVILRKPVGPPEAKVVRREVAGVPRVEVVGRSKDKVEEIFWDTVTQIRADLAGVPRK